MSRRWPTAFDITYGPEDPQNDLQANAASTSTVSRAEKRKTDGLMVDGRVRHPCIKYTRLLTGDGHHW